MSLALVTAPAMMPLTLNELKAHLRLDDTENDEDALIMGYLRAAIAEIDGADGWLGRALLTQTWDDTRDGFPAGDSIALNLPPIQSVSSVSYVDGAGATQTFASSNWTLSADRDRAPRLDLAYGASWPATRSQRDAVTIRQVCGWASWSAVPEDIRDALLIKVQLKFDQPDERHAARLERAADALLARHRVGWVG